jgi:uncharacterized lipoprotein YmbA
MNRSLICAMALLLGGCATARVPCDTRLTPINPSAPVGSAAPPARTSRARRAPSGARPGTARRSSSR